jgi:ATP-dependent protease ClpP protease subunit
MMEEIMPMPNNLSMIAPTDKDGKGWFKMYKNPANDSEATIELYDEIGGWGITSKQFLQAIKDLGKVSKITLRVNCPGGEILEGTAIYNALKEHPAEKLGIVDGLAASMATYVLMACDEIHMPSNTLFMIHNPQLWTGGDSEEFTKMAKLLADLKVCAIDAYKTHAKATTRADISELMDDETWMRSEGVV